MPQTIISQFDRAYNKPIETNRQVSTVTVMNAIPSASRWEGMLVYVITDGVTYELRGGLDNSNWQLFEGIAEAPEDGQYYARKDGSWELISPGAGQTIEDFEVVIDGLTTPGAILVNSFKYIRVGDIGQITGQVSINNTASFTSGSSQLTLSGFPQLPIGLAYNYELQIVHQSIAKNYGAFQRLTASQIGVYTKDYSTNNYANYSRDNWKPAFNTSSLILSFTFQIQT